MRPIESRIDQSMVQALRCVQYRPIVQGTMHESAYHAAIALRYGLIGAAAAYELLVHASPDDQGEIISTWQDWPAVVEEHLRCDSRFEELSATIPTVERIGIRAMEAVLCLMTLFRRRCSLDVCLTVASDEYAASYMSDIERGWSFFRKKAARKEFYEVADDSHRFAMLFFERRQMNLPEVPEIALLGE